MSLQVTDIPIFCINLDLRPDRWRKFQKQPGVQELPNLQRFSGIDGKTLDLIDNEQISLGSKYNILNKTRRSHDEIDTMGAVGATMSHTGIWKLFLERYPEQEYCLIFEDDAFIPPKLPEYIAHCSSHFSELKKPFDLWLLNYSLMDKKLTPLTPHWSAPNNFYSFSAYMISRDGAAKLLADAFPIQMHIDRYANMKMNLGQCNVIIHNDLKLATLGSPSDIQLGGCRICNVPNEMDDKNLRAVNKYYIYGLLGYAAVITVLYMNLKKKV
jgi:GR25 family glycosyltransferase involved in LPS biosynthesis